MKNGMATKKIKWEDRELKFYPNYKLIAELADQLAVKAKQLQVEAEKPDPKFEDVIGISDMELLPLALLIDKSIVKDNTFSINKSKSQISISRLHVPENVAKRKKQ